MSGTTQHDEHLAAALLDYLEAAQAGAASSREQIVAAHPDLRAELEEFFANHDEMERLAGPLRRVEGEACRAATPPSLGQLGDYLLLREAGRGGMGVVYEAEQISLRRRVALKVLPFAATLDPRQLQRFKNEALAAAHLGHENIVPVFAVGCERGVHYYAMQFIEGQSLAALLAEMRRPRDNSTDATNLNPSVPSHPSSTPADGRRYFAWVARLGRQAALALEHAHQAGVVHRDIKPANLMLDPWGKLWVTDFGLAQMGGDTGVTMTGELLGTLRYASPEQAMGRSIVDQRGDVYSLGATLYELLALRPVFEGRDRNELLRQIADEEPPPPRSAALSVPLELETIILKALRKDPAERYSSARELADDLERFAENRPILACRPGLADHLWKWARRHPSLVAAGVAVLILLSIGSVISAALIRAEQGRTRAAQVNAEAAYRREKQRAEEAEARLRLAQRAVNELIQVSEEELAGRPGLEGVRKRLLRSALAYYQEIAEQRRDDPDRQAELLDTARRVERILADLAVLRAATKLYLLTQNPVLADLKLDARRRAAMRELTGRVGREWAEALADAGRMPHVELSRRAVERARGYEVEVNAILTAAQQARLREIGWQSEGPAAFRDPEVVSALGLDAGQRERIRAIEDEVLFAWMRVPGRATGPGTDERIMDILTPWQASRWQEIRGRPLKGLQPFGVPAPASK